MKVRNRTNVVIVESPTKVKTISKYLGDEFDIEASIGHIRDLPKHNRAVDVKNGFEPVYEIPKAKESVVEKLKKITERAKIVFLATDPDREGEAIAWHITQILNLPKDKYRRVTFYEITEDAVKKAFERPRDLDFHLIKAQEARRVLDRLVGYDLSGLIWKKLRYGLSAGRVQSPALRILAEREREIRNFVPQNFWVITADIKTKKGEVLRFISSVEQTDEKEVERIVTTAQKRNEWIVKDVSESEMVKNPSAPFITSSLQQAASSRLGFSPSNTMRIAQKLYEAGFITYMRTDSPHLSGEAIGQITNFITKKYGEELVAPRVFKTKTKSAQEAHEAIRPTNITTLSCGQTEEQKRLYKLIWTRSVTSQMASARMLKTKIILNIETDLQAGEIPDFYAHGSRITYEGWLMVDHTARKNDVELPRLAKGDILNLVQVFSEKKETQPPNRYSEAGLIRELEKRDIGRPSTYATILQTLIARGYVEKIQRSLKVTDTGDVVSGFLEKYFPNIVNDSFTAEMEEELDEIAEGKREYKKTLSDFYVPFKREIENKSDIPKITTLGDADPSLLCPVCGSKMVIKLARNGKFLSCSRFPECIGARKIDGSEMAPPKEIGEDCPECGKKNPPAGGGKLVEREGRFGMFVSCSNYPKCKYVKRDVPVTAENSTGVRCPSCKNKTDVPEGYIVSRRGRFGPFFSCSNYPKCSYIIKSRPTGNICSLCGSLMMEGTKTIPERCSNKTCKNHNPHKLEVKNES